MNEKIIAGIVGNPVVDPSYIRSAIDCLREAKSQSVRLVCLASQPGVIEACVESATENGYTVVVIGSPEENAALTIDSSLIEYYIETMFPVHGDADLFLPYVNCVIGVGTEKHEILIAAEKKHLPVVTIIRHT